MALTIDRLWVLLSKQFLRRVWDGLRRRPKRRGIARRCILGGFETEMARRSMVKAVGIIDRPEQHGPLSVARILIREAVEEDAQY